MKHLLALALYYLSLKFSIESWLVFWNKVRSLSYGGIAQFCLVFISFVFLVLCVPFGVITVANWNWTFKLIVLNLIVVAICWLFYFLVLVP